MSRTTLYSWFRGDTSPDTVSLARLARLLELTPGQLLESLEATEVGTALAADLGLPLAPMSAAIEPIVPAGRPVAAGERFKVDHPVGARGIAWCDADDPVGPAAHRLYDENYSQMPVRDRGRWTGLLTGEVIARWMAGHTRAGLTMQDRTPIREVMAYAEATDNFAFVAAPAARDEIINLFTTHAERGRPLAAVLEVAGGRAEADITRIFTPYDVPRLDVRD